MRPSNKSRSRNKSGNNGSHNHNNNNNGNQRRSMGNIINRVFESAGPDGKVRGTPQQIIDKYQALARDAQLAGDRVTAENYLQHSEHYSRLLGEAQRQQAETRVTQEREEGGQPAQGQPQAQQGQSRGDESFDGGRRAPAASSLGSGFGMIDPDGDEDFAGPIETPEGRGDVPQRAEASADAAPTRREPDFVRDVEPVSEAGTEAPPPVQAETAQAPANSAVGEGGFAADAPSPEAQTPATHSTEAQPSELQSPGVQSSEHQPSETQPAEAPAKRPRTRRRTKAAAEAPSTENTSAENVSADAPGGASAADSQGFAPDAGHDNGFTQSGNNDQFPEPILPQAD